MDIPVLREARVPKVSLDPQDSRVTQGLRVSLVPKERLGPRALKVQLANRGFQGCTEMMARPVILAKRVLLETKATRVPQVHRDRSATQGPVGSRELMGFVD